MAGYASFDSFLLFGDSITQFSFDVNDRGFGAQLANAYQRRLDIINRGFSGYTSEQAIHLLPQILPRTTPPSPSPSSTTTPKIQFLTIFFGANDACLAPSSQHVPLDRYAHNLRTLLDMIHNPSSSTYSPATKIIVICPPPVDEAPWAVECQQRGMAMNRDKDVTRQYAATCLQVAQEYAAAALAREGGGGASGGSRLHQVDVIDTWGIMMAQVESGPRTLSDFLKDGIHLAAEGNNVIYEEIIKILRNKYSEWDPDKMLMHGPWWRQLDLDHPETDLLICGNKQHQSSHK